MGFFNNLFGGGASRKVAERSLRHPRDLRAGDIIKFGLLPQTDISGKEFEVTHVNTYIYGEMGYPELVLKDREGKIIFLMVEEEDGEEYMALSKKVGKVMMQEIMGPWDLNEIKKVGTGTKIDIAKTPEGFEEWMVDQYIEVQDAVMGAYMKGDARNMTDAELQKGVERFSSYILEDKTEEFALEIEGYESGETEMCVTVYHELRGIEEMWPGQSGGNHV